MAGYCSSSFFACLWTETKSYFPFEEIATYLFTHSFSVKHVVRLPSKVVLDLI